MGETLGNDEGSFHLVSYFEDSSQGGYSEFILGELHWNDSVSI